MVNLEDIGTKMDIYVQVLMNLIYKISIIL